MGMQFFSCSSVKFVPEEEYLLNKVDLNIDNPEISKDQAKSFIRQKENYKILGFFKFHLWLYNLSSKKNTDDWLKKIGESPQVYDEGQAALSENQLKLYLNSKGYFRSSIDRKVKIKEKSRKANVTYDIKTGNQYKIRKVDYHFTNPIFRDVLMNDSVKSEIKPGSPFDFDLLEQQRDNIVNVFKNKGYYYFSKQDVRYLADTTKYHKQVDINLYVGVSNLSKSDSLKKLRSYWFNDFFIRILPGSSPVNSEEESVHIDTLRWDNFSLIRTKGFRYKPELFTRSFQMKTDERYNLFDVEQTFTALNQLRQFRFIDIQFNEAAENDESNLLDAEIRLAPLNKQSTSFDLEGTNTSGNLGIAGNINYQHRNLFAGAEVFQLNFKGAMERQQRVVKNKNEYFNTRELGVESKVFVPKLIGPGRTIKAFNSYLPKTVFTAGYNYQRRPEYTRTIANFKFGYDWKTNERLRHTWNLFDFNMVNLYEFDEEFIERIKDLYIKSSFTDHLVLAMNYSVVYNTQNIDSEGDYKYLRFNVESAGNILQLLSSATNQNLHQNVDTLGLGTIEYYKILNTRFAQYLKADIEFRYGYFIDRYNSVVSRAFVGVGLPYGNFDVLPFEKKYFAGGANGIRAWQVRSLGPGTYKAPENAYPNQSSDIKIEANIEYRFNLISFIEGALFLDAGNIWAINKKDNREGALFKFNNFYKQIAIGTGTGLRFDFSYFLFRLDLGMKLRDPSQPFGNGWIIGKRRLDGDDFNLSFAIGYPF